MHQHRASWILAGLAAPAPFICATLLYSAGTPLLYAAASGLLIAIAIWAGAHAILRFTQVRQQLDSHLYATQTSLRKSEHLLQMAVDMNKMGAWSAEFPGPRIWWSKETYRLHEVDPDHTPELDSSLDYYPLDARKIVRDTFLNCAKNGTPFDIEIPFITAKGRHLWVRSMGEAEMENGSVLRIVGTFQDITASKKSLLALEESRRFLQLALSGAEMSISDRHLPSGRILFDNNWAHILGYEPHEVRQTLSFWNSLIPPDDLEQIHLVESRHLEGDLPLFDVEYRMRAKDGTYHWVLERSKVVEKNAAGRPVRLSGILLDITAHKRTEQALRDAKLRLEQALETEKELARKAQAAEQAKGDFLAMMSHEIRTPMNGVLGFADLLAMTSLDHTQLEYTRTIQRSGGALLRIIDDILDFSRLEAGQLDLDETPFSPAQVLTNIQNLLNPSALQRGALLIVAVDPAVPETLLGAADRLQQVLVNLVGNAIKFTPHNGRIHLEITPGDTPGTYRFSVSDTGIGIPEERLTRIFEPFVQGEASLTRRYGGTGLGLAISKRFVHLMGGELCVTSKPHCGSTFYFSLSLPEVDGALRPVMETEDTAHLLREDFGTSYPMNILVAEDDSTNRKLIVRILRRLGYSALVARNGTDAVSICRSEKPHCILMDLHMPELDGIEATRRIRALSDDIPVFIAAVTADVLQEERERCTQAGMNAYLTKPIKLPELLQTLSEAWRSTVALERTASS